MTALSELVSTRRVLVTVGAGGVGKTTTAAALGVAGALRGKRVLCLTIDPAKRLAESLGIAHMATEAHTVDKGRFAEAGLPLNGSLTAMMLDTKRTFDELVTKYASSPARAERILKNKLYGYVSTSLAGTQEYMAMEKLVAVKDDPRYDLIVLDTPPTPNALDFLDAPARLVEALDSATMRWFVQAFESTGKFSINILAKGAAVALRALGKITGGSFLESMSEFITDLNDLFGGFKERALLVQDALRAQDIAFVLVASPSPVSLDEAKFFSTRLAEHRMPQGAFVVNRVRMPPPFADHPPMVSDVAEALRSSQLDLGPDGAARVVRAHREAVHLAELDRTRLASLDTHGLPIVRVPELSADVYDLRMLARVAQLLTGDAAHP